MNFIDETLNDAGLLELYNLDVSDKFFIAGGACTRLFYRAKSLGKSDLDIYATTDYSNFISDVMLGTGKFFLVRQNYKVKTFLDPLSNTNIQIVSLGENSFTGAMKCTIGAFDISACALVYRYGEVTDLGSGDISLLQNRLFQIKTVAVSPERVWKYMSRYNLRPDCSHAPTLSWLSTHRTALYTGVHPGNFDFEVKDDTDYNV
jgi:hypothetical protein